MPELHETMMGKELITSDIPKLVNNIEKLGGILEKINVTLEEMYDIILEFKSNQDAKINK
jgi:hypothetical protein